MKISINRLSLLGLSLFLVCGCGKHSEIGITFGARDQANGLKRISNGDGNSVLTNAFGSACRLLEERPETYLYFRAAPEFKKHAPMTVTVTVECLAAESGSFDVQYDGGTPDDAYTASAKRVQFRGSGDWQMETFQLSNARFQHRQNNGADFRLRVNCPAFYVRRVTVRMLAGTAAPITSKPKNASGKGANGMTPLHTAAANGRKDEVERLLAAGADVRAKANDGATPLHWAVFNNHKDVAELLLASKPDINGRGWHGYTPLHWAAAKGFKDIAELLLNNQADINAKDDQGETPLRLAISNKHPDLADLLRQHGGQQ